MNWTKYFFLLALTGISVTCAFGQNRFTNCSAAFLDNKMVVDEYTTQGKCIITPQAVGELTVQTANLSPEKSIPTGKIDFRIAIRDGNTQTLYSFSDATYQQIDIRKVLSRCRPGDSIVLLTCKDKFALPHNEILVKDQG
ncbi:MAG: hypothetical protein KDC66_12770 [Phaeodactylibacter sp.]|nr:hypothetical protein [Phaeodactylibacter sp.]